MHLLKYMFSGGWMEFYPLEAVNHELFIDFSHVEESEKVDNASGCLL